jgi:carbon monoxide dehydrogenase subunit G
MATIRKEFQLDASPGDVWDAVRDFGAVHLRVAPGFLADCRMEGNARIVTFANGLVARELLVDIDERNRRLAYAITEGRTTHYNASMQIFDGADGETRAVWIIDVLPDEMAGPIDAMAEHGVAAMRRKLGRPVA